MSSNLNGAAKKNEKVELGVTVLLDKGEGLEFPPLSTQKYPIAISTRALQEYIARGGEILVIPAGKGGKPVVQKEDDRDAK